MSLITAYAPLPISFQSGQGIWLTDTQGNQYLDAITGIGVCCLGHAHPAVTQTITQQAQRLIHTSNLYQIDAQLELAQQLTQLAGLSQAFFANSGAEANEAALKLARLYGHRIRQIEQPQVIVMEGGFHGRTLATLTASAARKVHAGFEPLVTGFIRAPYNDIDSLVAIAEQQPNVVAVLLEPIQGEGGIQCPADDYLRQLRALCDTHDWLLIVDEIQTGMGRTGQWFAHQQAGIHPDIMTLAKALGNGFPIGACLMGPRASDLFQPGNHGSTFGGNPLACYTALTVINTIKQDRLWENATTLGTYLHAQLHQQLADNPHVVAIRGHGLMIGVELDQPCRELMHTGLQHGILFNVTADRVVRLLPPFILTHEQADQLIERLVASIASYY